MYPDANEMVSGELRVKCRMDRSLTCNSRRILRSSRALVSHILAERMVKHLYAMSVCYSRSGRRHHAYLRLGNSCILQAVACAMISRKNTTQPDQTWTAIGPSRRFRYDSRNLKSTLSGLRLTSACSKSEGTCVRGN